MKTSGTMSPQKQADAEAATGSKQAKSILAERMKKKVVKKIKKRK